MSSRTYVFSFLLLLSPIALVILANYLFLRGSGELLTARDIVDRQKSGFVLYGTATNSNTYRYKLEMYQQMRPAIVAVGSSRVMQFRSWFFNEPFMTLGGAMNSLKEGDMLVADMLSLHRPRAVLLGLDFWWFDRAIAEATDDHTLTGGELRTNKLLFPIQSILDRKVSPSYFLATVRSGVADCAGCDKLGLNAAINFEGFGPDGSYYYLGTLSGLRPSLDYRFSRSLGLVSGTVVGPHPLAIPASPDPQRVKAFRRIVDRLRNAGSEVVVFLPPVAPSVLNEMKRLGRYSSLREAIAQATPPEVKVFDFTDPAALGESPADCEFVDGTHGGEVLYLRMVAAMARLDPGAWSQKLIDDAARIASEARGHAMVPHGPIVPALEETDFLGLGCPNRTTRSDASHS